MAKAGASDKALTKEYETYKAHLPELVKDEGKFVLVHEAEVAGTYPSYQDALLAGYKKFGLKKTFLVKQISSNEVPVYLR
jgi:hypothetical protein